MLEIYKSFTACFLLIFSFASNAENVCYDNLERTTPTSDFVIHDDGTVTHTKTGLMWMRCNVGRVFNVETARCDLQPNNEESFFWGDALQAAKNLNANGGFAGYGDWRIPNVKELISITEYGCQFYYNQDVFGVNSAMLSATPKHGTHDQHHDNNQNDVYQIGRRFTSSARFIEGRAPFYKFILVRDAPN